MMMMRVMMMRLMMRVMMLMPMMMRLLMRVMGQFSNNDSVDKERGMEGKAERTKASKNGEIKRVDDDDNEE